MPLSRTVCSPYAETNDDRSVYQIWNLYIDPLHKDMKDDEKCKHVGSLGS